MFFKPLLIHLTRLGRMTDACFLEALGQLDRNFDFTHLVSVLTQLSDRVWAKDDLADFESIV